MYFTATQPLSAVKLKIQYLERIAGLLCEMSMLLFLIYPLC